MSGRIAVIVTNEFEDSEYTKPVEAFKGAGYTVVHIGLKEGETVKGKKEGTRVTIDRAVKDVQVGEFDALLIPGGHSPDNLRANDDAVAFTREFVESGKPVFAICHAAQLLITAQVTQGRKITGYKSIVQDIKNSGAEFLDQEVVVDGNIVSSRQPADLPAFNEACLKMLRERYSKAA